MKGFPVRFKVTGLITAAILSIGGGLVAAAPADASASQCPQGKLCLFTNVNFNSGDDVYIADSTCVHSLKGEEYPGNYPSANDTASSVVNNTNYTLRFFADENFGGRWIVVYAHTQIADLSKGQTVYNNDGTTSSVTSLNDQLSSIWSTTC